MKVYISLCMLLVHCLARLVVYHPRGLREDIDPIKGEIKSSIANFGLVHYGHSVVGRVWFDDNNPYGCDEFKLQINGEGDPDADPSPLVLVERGGNCSFVQKVRNVEHAGGRVALIMDSRVDENVENVMMVDDGTGNGIRIPSMLIGLNDGKTILKYLEDKNGTHTNPFVSLMAAFDIENPDNRVEWDFWYSSTSNKAYDFLKGYYSYHTKLGDKTLFTPKISFWSCEDCAPATMSKDCFSNGKYCGINDENKLPSGQDVLYESLRQKCLYNKFMKEKNEEMWWNYVLKAHAICYSGITKECSEQAHLKLGIDFKETDKCVKDSFFNANHAKSENDILRDEKEYLLKYGPNFFPSAVINNVTYRGALDPGNFFESICEGFKDKPEECGNYKQSSEGINTTTLLIIIVALVCINVAIIVIYKGYAKKEMDKKIEMHINSAVSQYFALQDKGESKTTKPLVY